MKILALILLSLVFIKNLAYANKTLKIGILLPIEHEALNQIVEGFSTELLSKSPNAQITIKNANGDLNIAKAIIENYITNQYDILVPIGTTMSQMAIAKKPKSKIVALAAKIDDISSIPNIIVVNDEIGTEPHVKLLSYLKAKEVTAIYSNNEKSISELEELKKEVDKYNIELKKLMVNNQQELYSLSKNIKTDYIVIFKDNLVANGIEAIIKQALKNQSLILSSDEGTVRKGVCAGIGVYEKNIGKLGAEALFKSIDNTDINEYVSIKDINLFINSQSCLKLGYKLNDFEAASKELGYNLVDLSSK